MEGPQDKRPIKTIKHLSFRIRNANGANKHEELLKLQLFVQAELAAKKIRGNFITFCGFYSKFFCNKKNCLLFFVACVSNCVCVYY